MRPPYKDPGLRETREQRRAAAEERKVEAKLKRQHDKHVHEKLEMRILTLEGRQKELTAELEKPETYQTGGAAMQLNREFSAVAAELERLTAEWEKLARWPEEIQMTGRAGNQPRAGHRCCPKDIASRRKTLRRPNGQSSRSRVSWRAASETNQMAPNAAPLTADDTKREQADDICGGFWNCRNGRDFVVAAG